MDGNRRWAKRRNLPAFKGHQQGVEAIRPVIENCVERGIKYLTLYAFSRENWGRSRREVQALMTLMRNTIRKETPKLIKNGVQVRVIGRVEELPDGLQKIIEEAVEQTRHNSKLMVNIAFNYGGRTEIIDGVRRVLAARLTAEQIDEETFAQFLYTGDIPDPDLLIRTGGEHRLSNFLLWQSAYSELYISQTLWPDFGPKDLDEALKEYSRRVRRYGK